jgi:hypothetical protein
MGIIFDRINRILGESRAGTTVLPQEVLEEVPLSVDTTIYDDNIEELKIGLITPTEHGILIVRPNASKVFYKLVSGESPTNWSLSIQGPRKALDIYGSITYTIISATSGKLILSKSSGSTQIEIRVEK